MDEPLSRIYVVDDDVDFQIVARRFFSKLSPNAEVLVFDSPGRAIAALMVDDARGRLPDLIVTDLIFPGSATGLDVRRSAKARGVRCRVCSEVADIVEGDEVSDKSALLMISDARDLMQ